jgi:hypothetical protein
LGLDVKQAKPVRLSPKEREAVIDALNRILAGEFDGDIPLRFYESALAKVREDTDAPPVSFAEYVSRQSSEAA